MTNLGNVKRKVFRALKGTLCVLIIFDYSGVALAVGNGVDLYTDHCASCHHPKRLGLTAPPLIPNLYSKKNAKDLPGVITNGLPATRMPAFKDKLTPEEIEKIVLYIETPVSNLQWDFNDIKASRVVPPGSSSGKTHTSDLENITLVMERGTKSLAVLDGDTFLELAKFYVGNVHGGPKFSFDLKKIYSISRDGIVTKFDIPSLSTEIRLKVGIYSRSIAVSADDRTVAVANNLPRNIVFFNQEMEAIHKIDTPGKIGGFYSLPQLNKFVCSFREKPELWIIDAVPPYGVKKHDLPGPFEDFSISPVGFYILGTKRGSEYLYIYDYKKNKTLKKMQTSGLPHLASAAFFYRNGELMVVVNHIKKPVATIYSLDRLVMEAEVPLPEAGFFVRTHFATPYIWTDTMTEDIVLIDKNDFTKRKVITPHPGRKSMHVEFTRNGDYAMVTIPGKGGEVVIYDAKTVEKWKGIPFEFPVGKYNATNKTYPAYGMGKKKNTDAGDVVFKKYCMGCHHQIYDAFGPSFTEIAGKRREAQIRAHIISPKSSAKGLGYKRSSMPHIKLNKKEMDNIVSYIMSFRSPGEDGRK